jgi:hypothetical protein
LPSPPQAQEYLKGYDHSKLQLTFWDGTKIAQMIDGLSIDGYKKMIKPMQSKLFT